MSSATMTIRLESEEKALISDNTLAAVQSAPVSMRGAALKRIEDEFDLRVRQEAKAEFGAGLETLSAEDSARKCL